MEDIADVVQCTPQDVATEADLQGEKLEIVPTGVTDLEGEKLEVVATGVTDLEGEKLEVVATGVTHLEACEENSGRACQRRISF